MMPMPFGFIRPRLLVGALLFYAIAIGVEAGVISRSGGYVTLPPAAWVMTPYFDGEALVVHLQRPVDAATTGPQELLIDARSGAFWDGDFSVLIAGRGRRLGLELPTELSGARGLANRQLLEALGCSAARHNRGCSLPEDAEVLLFANFDKQRSRLSFEVVDLRLVASSMTKILSGQMDWEQAGWTDAEWRVLAALSRLPEWRDAWLDAIRSVTDPEAFTRLARSHAGLGMDRRVFLRAREFSKRTPVVAVDEQITLDVRGEVELAGFRLLTRQLAKNWLRDTAETQLTELADVIAEGLAPPNQIRVREHMAEVLVDALPVARLAPLSKGLSRLAGERRSEDLRCFSLALVERSCVSPVSRSPASLQATTPRRAPVSAEKSEEQPAVPLVAGQNNGSRLESRERERVEQNTLGGIFVGGHDDPSSSRGGRVAEDVSQEVAMIGRLPNKAVLMAFGEAKGRLDMDASIGGLTFVARSLGAVQDGRFDVQVSPSKTAPVRLSRGRYRVKVRLLLDYSREDSCRGGALGCLLVRTVEHGKSEQRDVTFHINAENSYSNVRPANFGSLLPLVADGGSLYNSRLKTVRLSVKSVRLELE